MKRPPVSIIVTSFNRQPLFHNSYHTIRNQISSKDEFIIVEEGTDRTWPDWLQSIREDWTFIYTNNTGYRSCAKAKNVALKLANNPIIIINDPEVKHLDLAISELVTKLMEDERQFVVPGTLYSETSPKGQVTRMLNSQAPFVAGVYKKELEDVGGWDERFIYWGNDDNDLMYRLGLNGCRHRVLPQVQIHHQWHERPPQKALGSKRDKRVGFANELLLYEEDKSIVANKGKEWGKILRRYEITKKKNHEV